MRNNKGFADLVIVAMVVLAALVGVVASPVISKVMPQSKNTSSKDSRTKVEQPVYAINTVTGDIKTVGTAKWDIINSQDIAEQPKMTLWERIMMLPKIFALLAILGVIFPPLGIWLIKKVVTLKGNFAQIVTGIEEARKEMLPEEVKKLENNLSKKSDLNTKKLVKEVKIKL
ncbi:hypothetical protein A2V80_00855 [Candidatus Woesebacteria bacterium RBG_16_39_8b]|uniref:Uncharacterized protein n=1 Tax=Candidatus Woesebacteria bacterium RBG_16_39_8b TaxID=1802482 RepID=A0A1F7XBY5_9BACT|nr:MAG: hypothetical protein A2V80_00855 [Candidatus Woesebacteria bacterium RBG_16_39_8b]